MTSFRFGLCALAAILAAPTFANCIDYTQVGMAPIVEICDGNECEMTFVTAECGGSFVATGFANGLYITSEYDHETETSKRTYSLNNSEISEERFSFFTCKPLVSVDNLETDEGFAADMACRFFK